MSRKKADVILDAFASLPETFTASDLVDAGNRASYLGLTRMEAARWLTAHPDLVLPAEGSTRTSSFVWRKT